MTRVPLRRVARLVNGGTPTSEDVNWGGDIPWATPVDLARVDGKVIRSTNRNLTRSGLANGSNSVPKGSVLLSTRAPIGYVAIAGRDIAFNQGCKGLVPLPGIDARLLSYWLSAQRNDLHAAGSGSTFMELSSDALMTFPVPYLSTDKQHLVGRFLDDQVARIDNIIAARWAHTEGVKATLQSMVDIETSMGSARRIAPALELLRDGTHTPPPRIDGGVPLLTAKNLKSHALALTTADTTISVVDADMLDRSFRPRHGDVLLSVKGTVGNVATVPMDFPRFQIERNIALLRPRVPELRPEWLYWSLRSRAVQDQIRLAMGFSAQPGVYLGDLGNLQVAIPSESQQLRSVARLRTAALETSGHLTILGKSHELLTELKRSLITAAVTGEFDVSSADGSQVPLK